MEVDDPRLIQAWSKFPELEFDEFMHLYHSNKDHYDLLLMYLHENNEAI